MKGILLDTHAFLWFATGDEDLSIVARDAITRTDEVFVSAASAWEVRTKYRLGKLSSAAVLAHDLAGAVRRLELTELPITFADGDLAGALAGTHRDPFDRMLIAQSLNHELSLVSNEAVFDEFGVTRIW
ncbi:MAG TPA: type II toxin-antitoxin system VapC family toxin [Gemmatimonadaceae bacterium]|nr:type II toxin-antitoxin system VapC family toxin [Gemmatimonadaceae bacterium]